MLRISEILINELQKQLEVNKRNASGTASASLREEVYSGGVRIMGIDYFDNIFHGVPAGQNITLGQLNDWASIKQAKYGVGVSGVNALNNIINGNAWINSQPDKLDIDSKVLVAKRIELNEAVKEHLDKQIRQFA